MSLIQEAKGLWSFGLRSTAMGQRIRVRDHMKATLGKVEWAYRKQNCIFLDTQCSCQLPQRFKVTVDGVE